MTFRERLERGKANARFVDELRNFLGLDALPPEASSWKRSRNGRRKPGGCVTPYCRKPAERVDEAGLPRCEGCAA